MTHTAQSAMAVVPDPRVEPLCKIYSPKKITLASLEMVDTPGLTRSHDGNPAQLALIRDAGCLIFVGAAYGGGRGQSRIQHEDNQAGIIRFGS